MLQLIDKGYYDYDFERAEIKPKWEHVEKSQEQVAKQGKRFGFGRISNGESEHKPLTAEEMQAAAMEEMREKSVL